MIQYRAAHISDYDPLCLLLDEIDALHREARPRTYRKPEGPVRERKYIEDILADSDHLMFLAADDGGLVGILHVSIQQAKDIPLMVPRSFAYIECIVVAETHKRRGIGSRLLEEAERWATSKGAKTIELGVLEFNQSAITFYHRAGFNTESRRMSKHLFA